MIRSVFEYYLHRFGIPRLKRDAATGEFTGPLVTPTETEIALNSVDESNENLASSATIAGGYGNKLTVNSAFSFVGAGENNKIDNYSAAVVSGSNNNNESGLAFIGAGDYNHILNGAFYGFIGAGQNNRIQGNFSIIGGGAGNDISGNGVYGVVVGGQDNTVTRPYGVVLGGKDAVARDTMQAFAAGSFNNERGSAQRGCYVVHGEANSDSVSIRLYSIVDNYKPSIELVDYCIYTFTGTLSALDIDTGDAASFKFEGAIKRWGDTIAILLSPVTPVVIAKTAGAASWSMDVLAETDVGGLNIVFNGEAGKTIRATCLIDTVETTYRLPQPPWNDNWASGMGFSDAGISNYSGTTLDATAEPAVPFEEIGYENVKAVWFQGTFSQAGTLTIDTLASLGNPDTILVIFRDVPTNIDNYWNDNDDFEGSRSKLTTEVEPGVTYYVAVSGYYGDAVDYVFNAVFTPTQI